MAKNPFEVLETTDSVSESQLYEAYKAQRAKYEDKRFGMGEEGRIAAEKLDDIEEAYREARDILREKSFSRKQTEWQERPYEEVEAKIRAGDFQGAQELLDCYTNRNAEWHYYYAIIYFKKGWYNEAINEINIAINLDPTNSKYRDSLKELQRQTQASGGAHGYYGGTQGGRSYRGSPMDNQPAGGCTACECCQGLICADCCCECMGGDLISCC